MARVHTDFIILNQDHYDFFLELVASSENSLIIEDVPLRAQSFLERKCLDSNKFILKRQYVK